MSDIRAALNGENNKAHLVILGLVILLFSAAHIMGIDPALSYLPLVAFWVYMNVREILFARKVHKEFRRILNELDAAQARSQRTLRIQDRYSRMLSRKAGLLEARSHDLQSANRRTKPPITH